MNPRRGEDWAGSTAARQMCEVCGFEKGSASGSGQRGDWSAEFMKMWSERECESSGVSQGDIYGKALGASRRCFVEVELYCEPGRLPITFLLVRRTSCRLPPSLREGKHRPFSLSATEASGSPGEASPTTVRGGSEGR